jgi:hypothetical protein
MSDDAGELVKQLVKAGEWPDPKLLTQILARGQDAVGPLLEVVTSHPQRRPKLDALPHAIMLLGILRPPEAMAPLLGLFQHYDEETPESLPDALVGYGPAVVEPALATLRDTSLSSYPRTLASSVAVRVAREHPELQAPVAAALRELLAECLARAPDHVKEGQDSGEDEDAWDEDEDWEDEDWEEATALDEYLDMTTALVEDLAELGDTQGRDLIDDAFDAKIVDEDTIDKEGVEAAYEEAARPPEKSGPRAPLEEYRKLYRENEQWEGPQYARGQPFDAPPPFFRDEVMEPFRREGRQIGRNDPCWCGSGKKYKKCHMREDQR